MKTFKHIFKNTARGYQTAVKVAFVVATLILIHACEYDFRPPPPPPPPPPAATSTLEAQYVQKAPTLNDSYWTKTANYLNVKMGDTSSTGNLYPNGMLNMTGTYNGKQEFNNGNDPGLTLRAAYDDHKIYILAEWSDNSLNVSSADLVYDGKSDPLKTDTTGGWTSQRNSDKLAFAFDINGASGDMGTFSNVGCAASCHNTGTTYKMQPQSGKVDLWDWDVALSDPLGYAFDMVADNTGMRFDSGTPEIHRNTVDGGNRSAPAYEWDGTTQSYTKPNGKTVILDPAYFLLNKTAFTGDAAVGEAYYSVPGKGCFGCHGVDGYGFGEDGDGPAFTTSDVNHTFSSEGLRTFASSDNHDGSSYFNKWTPDQQTNLIARIKSFFGTPGYYLSTPDGSCADIIASSNILSASVNTSQAHAQYKVLLVRDLNTGNDDDVQFDPSQHQTCKFSVALMDNDGKNHIGAVLETLTFMKK